MESNLRQLQEDLLLEWGKLEGQVTKLDLWMAENGHVVTEAVSLKSLQLFEEKRNERGPQSKIFEVVDELQLHKERILVQIGKFSEIGIKFNEYYIEVGYKPGDDTGPAMKIDLVSDDEQDISDSLQETTCSTLPGFSYEDPKDDLIDPDNGDQTDQSNSIEGPVSCPEVQSEAISKAPPVQQSQKICGRNPPVQCSICSKTVKRKSLSNYIRLVQNHALKSKPVATKAKSTNFVPISITTWNAPVQCPICSKTIKQSCNLDFHMRTTHHPNRKSPSTQTKRPAKPDPTNESKPFACGHCSKTFGSRSSLSYHMRSVRGERPYVCRKNCTASFPCPRNRNQHEEACKGRRTLRGRKPVYL